MKLHKIGFLIVLVILLVSCSKEVFSLEERVVNKLNDSDIYFDEIIHYELKDDYIYVFYTVEDNLFYKTLDMTSSDLEFIDGRGSLNEHGIIWSEIDTLPYYFAYFISNNPEVTQVDVHGHPAKKINSKDVSFWIAYSELPLEENVYAAYDHEGIEVELILVD